MTEPGRAYDVDVAILSDFRLPGGTTSSIAEEVRAQSAAGITTALVHVAGAVTNYALGFSQHIRRVTGLPHVRLATAHSQLRAKVIIVRHPTVIFSARQELAGISGDKVVIVANHAAIDAAGVQHYDIAATDKKVRDLFGVDPIWAPIGPVVRATMLQQTTAIPFSETDWVNIFSMPAVDRPRTGFLSDKPVIGRHSRPQPGKWPATGDDILAAYPPTDEYPVRILGGAEVAEHLIGYVPENWDVIPFGGEDPAVFLDGIDFWVYMHHPDLREAFGRAAMEALASGCVAIMPPYMRELFGDAALYAEPHEVQAIVDEYFADKEKFLQQSRAAQEFARSFSPQLHVDRLGRLGVQAAPGRSESVEAAASDPSDERSTALIIIDAEEGAQGLDLHEFAELALSNSGALIAVIADKPDAALPATSTVCVATARRLNMEHPVWEQYTHRKLVDLIEQLQPARVGYAGEMPSEAVLSSLREVAAQKIWIGPRVAGDQTAKDAMTATHVAAEKHFHSVVEQGQTKLSSLFADYPEAELSTGGIA